MKKKLRIQKVKLLVITSLVFLLAGIYTINAQQTRYAVANGNWNATSTWSATSNGTPGASVPVAGDIVFIQRGFTVTVTSNATCANIYFGTSSSATVPGDQGTLTVTTGVTLTVTNGVQLNNADTVTALISGQGTLNCTNLTIGNGYSASSNTPFTHTLTSTILTLSIAANLTINSYNGPGANRRNDGIFNHTSGLVSVNGTIVTNAASGSTSSFILGNSSPSLILGGSTPFLNTGTSVLTLNGTGSTVNYSFLGAQTVGSTAYHNLTVSGSGVKTTSGVTVQGNLLLTDAATLTPNSTLTVSGTTTLRSSSVLTLGATEILSTTPIVLSGGTLRTGVTTGFTETLGTLNLNGNSTIALGTGNHSLNFSDSAALPWVGTSLTITGWTGVVGGSSGTAGKIFVGTNANGLTEAQLSKINFSGFNPGAVILSTGELVPSSPNLKIAPTNLVFGYQANGSTSVNQTYTLSGTYLTGFPGTIRLNAPSGFEISLAAGSGFGSTINVPYTTATLAETIIYVRFKPLAPNTNYSGSITNTGGGATVKNVAVSGTSSLSILYCSSSGNMAYQTSITAVNFNTIASLSAKPSGYSDYTSTVTSVITGNAYPLSVRLNTDGNYTVYARAWIDWNSNGNFDDAGEIYNLGTVANQTNGLTSISPTIIVPEGIVGNVRMRIASKYNAYPTSCELNFDGEVEDYSLNIIPRSISTGVIADTTYCAGASVSVPFTLSGTVTAGNVFTAQLSDASGSFTSPVTIGSLVSTTSGTIAATIPIASLAGTAYRIRVVSSTPVITGSNNGVDLTINPLPVAAGSITGTATVCQGQNIVSYAVPAITNATSYTWSYSGTGATISGNVNNPTINFSANATSGNLTVVGANSCGNGTVSSNYAIIVNPATPVAPGAITGATAQCPLLASQVYSITAVPNATTYNWTVPTGWSITAGLGTPSITVTTGTAGQNGTIAVTAQNTCGISTAATLAVLVNPGTPATPGSITGTTTQCLSYVSQVYSISAVTNATSYNWTVPTGWTIVAGSGTPSITVTTGTAGVNGNITVTAQNSCGTSAAATLAVTTISCSNYWKGSVSTDWNTPSNWTLNMIPAVDADISFDANPLNHLVMDQHRAVNDITITQSTYQLKTNGFKLTVKGRFIFSNQATIDATSPNSIIELAGSNIQTMENNPFLNDRVSHLIIDNAAHVLLNSSLTVSGNLTINLGKTLVVSPDKKLKVTGMFTNLGGVSNLIVKSDATGTASLIHNSDNVLATVQRFISGANEDWHLLASPVSNQSIIGSTWLPSGTYGNGTGYDLYVWDEPGICWVYHLNTTTAPNWPTVHPQATFVPGRGYLYSVQDIDSPKQNKRFEGALNNGNVNYPITKKTLIPDPLLNGFNLVGNPYPSSIDWRAASGWTRNALKSSGSGYDMWIWNPAVNNYGVVNSTDLINTNGVSNFIAPMQGFFVLAETDGNLGFSNAIRTQEGTSNWLRTSNAIDGMIQVKIASMAGFGSDEVVLKLGAATNQAGAAKLFSTINTAPSVYFNMDKKELSVRHITNTVENPSIPISFKAGADGNYSLTIAVDDSAYETVVLEDKKTKSKHDLKLNQTYNFKAVTKDDAARFILHFGAISLAEVPFPARVFYNGTAAEIDLSLVTQKTEVLISDILGRIIYKKVVEPKQIHYIPIATKNQVYLVKLTTPTNNVVRKLFVHE